MAESARLKLFQKLIKAYTEAHKEKNGKAVQLNVSAEWKKMKKFKDSDLEVTVDKKISELKNLSMNKKVQSMAIWSKFVRGNPNNKHSGVSSEDVDEEEAAAIPVITASAENSSQSSSSYDSPTDLQQAVSTSNEKAKPMPKQDDLRKKIETETDILLGLCRKREYDM